MAASKDSSSISPQLIDIEQLKNKFDTSDAVYHGVKAAEGWKPGRQVSEKDYAAAVENFLSGSINGKKVEQNA